MFATGHRRHTSVTPRRCPPHRSSPQQHGSTPSVAGDSRWTSPVQLADALSAHARSLGAAGVLVPIWAHVRAWLASATGGGDASPVPRLVCLGLGSVAASAASGNAVVQLALLVLLRRMLHDLSRDGGTVASGRAEEPTPEQAWRLAAADVAAVSGDACCSDSSEGACVDTAAAAAVAACAHDPAFTPADVRLLAALGVAAVASADASHCAHCRGGVGGGDAALYLMPHCPGSVYGAVLAQLAWCRAGRARSLGSACVVGNSFSAYAEARGGLGQPGVARAAEAAAAAWPRCAPAPEGSGVPGDETLPPVDADALLAVLRRTTPTAHATGAAAAAVGGADVGAAAAVQCTSAASCCCAWRVRETALDALLAAAAGGRDTVLLARALSSTSVHSFVDAREGNGGLR